MNNYDIDVIRDRIACIGVEAAGMSEISDLARAGLKETSISKIHSLLRDIWRIASGKEDRMNKYHRDMSDAYTRDQERRNVNNGLLREQEL